jgi:hypothetical protein
MGQLLCNRRVGCRCPDRITICCHDADCRAPRPAEAGSSPGIRNTNNYSFRRRVIFGCTSSCSLEGDCAGCGLLGNRRNFGGGVHRRRTADRPANRLQDWLFNAILPFMAYATLAASAVAAGLYTSIALFGVGAATLLLLFVGIHNAWDTVAYHVLVRKGHTNGDEH